MSNSLREKLMGLGFKAPEPEPKRAPEARPASDRRPERRPGDARPGARPGERREGRPPSSGKPGERREGRPPAAGKPGERRPDSRPRPPGASGAPGEARPGSGAPAAAGAPRRARKPAKPRSQEEIDLAKAYAIRAQKEKDERIEAERIRQEEARLRREAKARLGELLKGQSLNDPAAEIARHFPYGGKIKRIHVNEAQLKALNAGELGVLQLDGRYLLVTAAMLDEAEKVFAPAVALRVDPNAPAGEDPYADPQYQVPDDLVW